MFRGVFPQVKEINNPLLDLLGFIHFWIIWFSANYLFLELIYLIGGKPIKKSVSADTDTENDKTFSLSVKPIYLPIPIYRPIPIPKLYRSYPNAAIFYMFFSLSLSIFVFSRILFQSSQLWVMYSQIMFGEEREVLQLAFNMHLERRIWIKNYSKKSSCCAAHCSASSLSVLDFKSWVNLWKFQRYM